MMFNAYQLNTLRYDSAKCLGCGVCVDVCPHSVFAMNGRKAILVHPLACMECGACRINCPTNAIAVESGVGCAAAMLRAALTGQKDVTCGNAECDAS